MKYILFALIFCPSVLFAGAYDDNFEKGGDGKNPDASYEDIKKNDGNYEAIDKSYEDVRKEDVDMSSIPKDAVDTGSGKDNNYGSNLGGSVKGKVSSEKSLSGVLDAMKTGGELETLGDTFVCPSDNETYGDINDCKAGCYMPCETYKFNVEMNCQKSSEFMKITPSDLGLNPSFNITFNSVSYNTGRIKAVCGNGFIDISGTSYEWSVNTVDKSFSFTTPYSNATLGECKVMSMPYMASFTDYLEPMAVALKAHVGKLGFIASHTINSDMSLSINIIVAGACDENSLKSGLPNSQAIDDMKHGKLDLSEAQNIAQSDPNYKYLVSGKSYGEKTCSITNSPIIYSNTKTSKGVDEFKGELPDVTKRNKGSTHVYNNGTLIGITQNSKYEKDYVTELTGRFLSSSLMLGDFINSNGDIYQGCNGYSPIIAGNSCQIENRWINSAVPFVFTVEVERSVIEDVFSVTKNDGCSGIPKGCSLKAESICDMAGGNCVETYSNAIATGNKVPKMCGLKGTSLDNYNICSDGNNITAVGAKKSFLAQGGYFTIMRTYSCGKNNSEDYDYSSFLEQDRMIAGSINVSDTGDVNFSTIGRDGSIIDYNTNITPNNTKCVQTCKVKKQVKEESIVISDGTVSTGKNTVNDNGTSKPLETSYYKPCDQKNEEWKCNLDSGETMISGCDCPDDFVDIIVQLKFVEESSKSIKCSTK